MESVSCRHIISFLLFFMIGNALSFSQNSKSIFYENEFDLSIPVSKKWSTEVGLGNRGLLKEIQDHETSGYQHQYLEINHFTNYNLKEFFIFSLGLRYRFNEIFEDSEKNEFRIIEQVEIESSNTSNPLSHRIRLEQRFREHTVHRLRYELEYSMPINETFSGIAGTEVLYAVSSHLKPEAEQRFSLGLENTSFDDFELELTFQYRMEDYARNLAHEFFIITGVSFAL